MGLLVDQNRIELHPDAEITDHVELFGLTDGAPARYLEIVGLSDGAVLAGTLRRPIGRHLFLDQPDGTTLLLDSRRLAGWTVSATDYEPRPGLDLRPRHRPEAPSSQDALF